MAHQRPNAIPLWVCVALGLLMLTGCARADDEDTGNAEDAVDEESTIDLGELLEIIGWKKPVGALVGVIGSLVLAPLTLRAIGFRSKGVRPGSIGSLLMSKNRGRVAAGGLIAGLQRAGAAGIGTLGKLFVISIGVAVGTYVGAQYDK